MIRLAQLSNAAAAAAPAIANHLWQSTLMLLVAALLCFALRRNAARVRHAVWLAGSIKFLIPFALLIHIGMHLAPVRPSIAIPALVQQASQLFDPAVSAADNADRTRLLPLLFPILLALLWLSGFIAVITHWVRRWMRVAALRQHASTATSGREWDALRSMEDRAATFERTTLHATPLLLSSGRLEPGVFGIFKPRIFWPSALSNQLTDAHLAVIFAHELCHIRRRDNLAAAIHMLVEAVFWFHPLVWWLGMKLLAERECACDEAVLRLGSDPNTYAESILKACAFCLPSPLPSVAGVSSSSLTQRIVHIMKQPRYATLSTARVFLLAAMAGSCILAPIFVGLAHAPVVSAQRATGMQFVPSFESTSIQPSHASDDNGRFMLQPGRLHDTNVTVKSMIEHAYNIEDYQLAGAPSWLATRRYDIDASASASYLANMRKLPESRQGDLDRQLMQALLADRFHLRLTQTSQTLRVYTLEVANGGPKFKPSLQVRKAPDGEPLISMRTMVRDGHGAVTLTGPIRALAGSLSEQLGTRVMDGTGLTGSYDLTYTWVAGDSKADSILSSLSDQLGLKLEPEEGAVEIFQLDRVDQPAAD